jgi:hypothetical protein
VRDRSALVLAACLACAAVAGCTRAGPAASAPAAAGTPARAAAVAAGPALTPGAVARAVPGWPVPRTAYLGRYRLTFASDRSFAQAGLLTLFMRTVTKPRAMVVPSGIISVYGPGRTAVLYLSRFGHLGQRGVADVTAGLYATAPAGTVALTAFSATSHTLTLVLSAPGSGPVTLRFTRYSANPHP